MGNQACGGEGRRAPRDTQKPALAEKPAHDRRETPPEGNTNVPPPADRTAAMRQASRVPAPAPAQPTRNDPPANIAQYAPNGTSHAQNGIVITEGGQRPNISLSHWATLQNEASKLLLQDKNPEALAKFKEALGIQTALLGTRHPDIALTLNNLGLVSRACGHTNEATSYFRQAVELYTEVYGPNDPRSQQARQVLDDHLARSAAARAAPPPSYAGGASGDLYTNPSYPPHHPPPAGGGYTYTSHAAGGPVPYQPYPLEDGRRGEVYYNGGVQGGGYAAHGGYGDAAAAAAAGTAGTAAAVQVQGQWQGGGGGGGGYAPAAGGGGFGGGIEYGGREPDEEETTIAMV